MPSLRQITSLALLIYGPLALVALLWAKIGQGRWAWSLREPWLRASELERLGVSLALGIGLALAVFAVTPLVVERTKWGRALGAELKAIVEPLSRTEITLLAVSSGLGEELFFRGALQPALGLVATSVIFGAFHVGPRNTFPAWAIWAFAVGLCFGLIFELTGTLWGSVLAHVWINRRNMVFLQDH